MEDSNRNKKRSAADEAGGREEDGGESAMKKLRSSEHDLKIIVGSSSTHPPSPQIFWCNATVMAYHSHFIDTLLATPMQESAFIVMVRNFNRAGYIEIHRTRRTKQPPNFAEGENQTSSSLKAGPGAGSQVPKTPKKKKKTPSTRTIVREEYAADIRSGRAPPGIPPL